MEGAGGGASRPPLPALPVLCQCGPCPSAPPPTCLHLPILTCAGLLRLYSLVPQVDGSSSSSQLGCSGAGLAAAAPVVTVTVTILHADLLSSFASLAPGVMPLLQAAGEGCWRGMEALVLAQALRGLGSGVAGGTCCQVSADVAPGSTSDIVERAADALRALCRWVDVDGWWVSHG